MSSYTIFHRIADIGGCGIFLAIMRHSRERCCFIFGKRLLLGFPAERGGLLHFFMDFEKMNFGVFLAYSSSERRRSIFRTMRFGKLACGSET